MNNTLTVADREVVWALKYRPNNLNEIILPERIKSQLQEVVSSGSSPHLLFSGPPGISKTTCARAIAHEMNASLLFINASLETGVDVLREKVTSFCTTMSAFGSAGRKVVILDEAENLSTIAVNSLRGLLEAFAGNALFIFTTKLVKEQML
jgi:replication factor C small subunit